MMDPVYYRCSNGMLFRVNCFTRDGQAIELEIAQ
jgi:hypothetical protein